MFHLHNVLRCYSIFISSLRTNEKAFHYYKYPLQLQFVSINLLSLLAHNSYIWKKVLLAKKYSKNLFNNGLIFN